jgi:hypothetical protein
MVLMNVVESDRTKIIYWTFFNNPSKWQFDRFLETGKTDFQYLISDNWQKHHIKPGHLGVIRVGTDARNRKILNGKPKLKPGIFAIVEILTSYYQRREIEAEHWLTPRDHILGKPTVKLRIVRNLLDNPILLSEFDIGVDDVHLIKGFEGRTMPLSINTFEKIEKKVGGIDESAFVKDFISTEDDITTLKQLDKKYAFASPQVRLALSKRIERGKVGEYVKKLNNYECQVCRSLGISLVGFKLRDSEINFVEAHHVHEVHTQEEGSLQSNNIIVVCPMHHRQIHFGKVELKAENTEVFIFIFDGVEVKVKRLHY